MMEESHRQMEKFWGKIFWGSAIGGSAIIAAPVVIRAAPAIWRLLQEGSTATGGAPVAVH
jgi:hypothetical protein